jgi:glycine dehydrogenase subunit 2
MGFHAPTIYFPLLFHEALMVEPTETESVETLDIFIEAMRTIATEAANEPDKVKNAPLTTPIQHPDETEAAVHPILTWKQLNN